MCSINAEGLAIIKHFESCLLAPYKDLNGYWTVGWGHKILPGDNIAPGDTITQAKADALLDDDIEQKCDAVDDLLEVDVSDNAFSALVSFVFNEGEGRLKNSTLLAKLNNDDFNGAAEEFQHWVFAAGIVEKGLVLRRDAEKALFLKPDFQGGHNQD